MDPRFPDFILHSERLFIHFENSFPFTELPGCSASSIFLLSTPNRPKSQTVYKLSRASNSGWFLSALFSSLKQLSAHYLEPSTYFSVSCVKPISDRNLPMSKCVQSLLRASPMPGILDPHSRPGALQFVTPLIGRRYLREGNQSGYFVLTLLMRTGG